MSKVGTRHLETLLIPKPEALVESMRAFGYELETAVADLIDNSLTAFARNIWIDFLWDGENSSVRIQDDGMGMDRNTVINAMRLGSVSPVKKRASHDLGRFGLGLKTASFSQCRRLSVRTQAAKKTMSTWTWDLDHIASTDKWMLIEGCSKEEELLFGERKIRKHGTIVLWTSLDRITSCTNVDDENDHQNYLQRAEKVCNYIGMVFHRFIEEGIAFFVNGIAVEAWDPFMEHNPSTQKLTEETLTSGIVVTPFVLPHYSKLNQRSHEAAGGIRGWNEHQGFFIYRNKRMLVAGHWLGFFIKEDHYKLARIRVDIPNHLDAEWGIDVKKSKAVPPDYLKKQLRQIADKTRKKAVEIYRFRGAKLTPKGTQGVVFVWEKKVQHGKVSYEINRKHPVVELVLKKSNSRQSVTRMLRMIEETIPVPLINITNSESPDTAAQPFETDRKTEILLIAEEAFESLRASGLTKQESIDRICSLDPFYNFPEILQLIKEKYEEKTGRV
jgi:hypothetical protein